MDKKELEKERVGAFDAWFDKWYTESDVFKYIEEKSKIRNLDGYTNIEIEIKYTEDQPRIRLDSGFFMDRLKEKFPDFDIYKRQIYKKQIFRCGRPPVSGILISIAWEQNGL